MKEIVVKKEEHSKKLSVVLLKHFPGLSLNNFNKALRKKDIRVNDIKVNSNVALNENDKVKIYVPDCDLIKNSRVDIENYIIYEDNNIIILNKEEGMCVTSDIDNEFSMTDLLVQYANGKYLPNPSHRLDRNTKGIVIFAKNEETLEELNICFSERLIDKYYKCLVYGILEKKDDVLESFLFKDAKKNVVKISNKKGKGYVGIKTKYTVINEDKENNISVLEVELLTGRTHQIRAHLASIGHFVIGDNKYGNKQINKVLKRNTQQLVAYKIKFNTKKLNVLRYLDGKVFEINVEF